MSVTDIKWIANFKPAWSVLLQATRPVQTAKTGKAAFFSFLKEIL